MSNFLFIASVITALGCGLIAGAFFAFSTFVMKALGKLPPNEGLAAMQSINIVVINPIFLGVFVGTAILCIVVGIMSVVKFADAGSGWLLAGCVLYFVGTFLVTMLLNVPLNNALAAVDPTSAEGAAFWTTFLTDWTFWNHVRTLAALFALASFIIGLYKQ